MYYFQFWYDVDPAGGNSLDTEVFLWCHAKDLLELVPDTVVYDPFTGYYCVDYTKVDADFCKME